MQAGASDPHSQPDAAAPDAPVLLPEILAYLDYLAFQRRSSAHTIANYRRDFAALMEMAAGRPLSGLKMQDVRRFVARSHAGGLSPRSIARRLSAWRGLYRWLVREGRLEANPVLTVRAPRGPKRLPKALSPDQAAALLDGTPDDALEVRDLAMFELFYSSGLRLSELGGLDLEGTLSVRDDEVTVFGKRGKTRTVPVGGKAREALQAWLALRPQIAGADEPALFVGQHGRRLSTAMIRNRLARWAQRQGLPTHVHPHMLRHSFASHVLQSSGDLRAVQELLGHASIATTQIYTHLDFQHLAKVYDAAHPRARKGK
ncbi:MAG: tyrosine recombinase XerC [Moraxellaceae bacterium]|nr:tyrosine recombinase XerC [Moraxellaceae bacterium]